MSGDMEIYLLGQEGTMRDCRFPLGEKSICLGTDPKSCAIIYPPDTKGISMVHCQLVHDDGSFIIVDYSEAGTWLNGMRLNKGQGYPLKEGDTIQLASPENSFKFCESVSHTPEQTEKPFSNDEHPHEPERSGYNEEIWDDEVLEEPSKIVMDNDSKQEREWHEEGIKEKYFSCTGRLNRKRYILRGLLVGFVQNLAVGAAVWIKVDRTPFDAASDFFVKVFGVIILVCLASQLTLVVRRLHDVEKSNWWLLVPLASWVGLFMENLSFLLVVGIFSLPLCYFLIFKKGTTGANKHGADPLGNR